MKKTIIAASIAAVAAAPAAFADVKISGSVVAEYVEDAMATNNDLVITASEDLGNGMKASAKMHNVYDDGSQGGADFTVSLSGDFGTITMGRQEGFQEGVFNAVTGIDGSHDVDLEGHFDAETSAVGTKPQAGFTRDEMIKYVSPSFNGLTVGFTAQDDGSNATEDTEVMVKYSNAGLTVAAGTGSEGDYDFTNVQASYKMGDLEVRAASRTSDNGTELDSTFIGAKYSMGANTISLGAVSTDHSADDAKIMGLNHALSKTTSVYVVHKDADSGADQTAVGMKVAF